MFISRLNSMITFTLFLFWSIGSAHAQIEQFYGTWISSSNDMLLIYDPAYVKSYQALTEINNHVMRMNVDLSGDTLNFWKEIERHNSRHQYDFKVVEQTKAYLTLAPVSVQSKNAFGDRAVIFYRDLSVEASFDFEKLIYIDSCRGHYNPCKLCFLEINGNQVIKLKKVTEEWSSRSMETRYFIDRLSDSTFTRLTYLLRTAGFQRYDYHVEDQPLSILQMNSRTKRIYYLEFNEEKLKFSTPFSHRQLGEFKWLLYELCHKYELKEAESFEFIY